MYKHFVDGMNPSSLDKTPFVFKHNLTKHPALTLENLCKVLARLPKDQVMYSQGLNDLNINFDRAHIDNKSALTIEETIENIKNSDSYIMVRSLEKDPSFQELYKELIEDVNIVMRSKKVGKKAIEPKLYLFIASPNAFTPFHIDRYSTFLFQIRGSKEVAVFDQFNDKVVCPKIRANFADYGKTRPIWSEEIEPYAKKYNFKPEEALHIPFISGHYIKNGPEDVSISLSIIFRTDESQMWLDALSVNNRLREKLKLSVTNVGHNPSKDKIKAKMLPIFNSAYHVKNLFR